MIEWILFKDRLCLDGLELAASEGKVSEILGCGAECVCIRLSGRVWVCVCAVNTIAHLASLTDMQYKHYKYATIWKSAFHTFCTDWPGPSISLPMCLHSRCLFTNDLNEFFAGYCYLSHAKWTGTQWYMLSAVTVITRTIITQSPTHPSTSLIT